MATGRLNLLWKFPELTELHCRRIIKQYSSSDPNSTDTEEQVQCVQGVCCVCFLAEEGCSVCAEE